MADVKKVGFIGAGVSGLIACKYVLQKGFHPVVFEASDSIGGVWTQTVSSTRLQTPRFLYEFSDFPWPHHVKHVYPDHEQVLHYLQSYAQHFDLLKHIRLNCRVECVEYIAASGDSHVMSSDQWGGTGQAIGSKGCWHIAFHATLLDSNHVMKVDFMGPAVIVSEYHLPIRIQYTWLVQCIHPRIPPAAIIGYSESLSNLYTSEMRIRWVVEFMDGGFKLPSIWQMEQDAEKWEKYMKQYARSHFRRSCVGALHIWYNDQLCKEMKRNPRRKGSWFEELFIPYLSRDYANL